MIQRGIDRFIVCAPRQRQFVEQELGVPVERFVDVRFGTDTRFWRPMTGAGDLICSVGQEMRDYGTLLEALRPLEIPVTSPRAVAYSTRLQISGGERPSMSNRYLLA